MALLFSNSNDNNLIKEIAKGAVGVLPTDTVYGLVASARNPHAVAGLYKLKHRENKPGTVIAASCEQLIQLGVEQKYVDNAKAFWPNQISIMPSVDMCLMTRTCHYLLMSRIQLRNVKSSNLNASPINCR